MSTPTIHKRQLFHWIGRHIEDPHRGLTAAEKVTEYVECLRTSLSGGLWMTEMDEALKVGARSHALKRRMVCFTENRLSECKYHSTRYGRLGLGFPKRYVLDTGGKPVSYVQHNKKDLYTASLLAALANSSGDATHQLDFILHFVKPLGLRRDPTTPKGDRQEKGSRCRQVPAGAPDARLVRRQFGPRMAYQSESEWRIVEHPELLQRTCEGNLRIKSGPERSLVPYRVGHDLMTIVFPDRATQQAALDDPEGSVSDSV